jgi:integrase/recombinase XerD
MAGKGKQAKILSDAQLRAVLGHVARSRNPERDRVMVLLSFKAGLRAIEIASLTWAMVTDSSGEVSTAIELTNRASKGKGGGRTIGLHPDLRAALVALHALPGCDTAPDAAVVYSERADGLSAAAVVGWFDRLYSDLGIQGASSHSGRRTFVTKVAKVIVGAGGSIRDVQQLAGHASLTTTQRYIEGDTEAKTRAIGLI